MSSFIFGGSTGMTAEQVKARREVAEQLAEQIKGRAPQNVGEGLTMLGAALASRRAASQAGKGEDALKGAWADNPMRQSILGALTGQAPAGGGYTSSTYTPFNPQPQAPVLPDSMGTGMDPSLAYGRSQGPDPRDNPASFISMAGGRPPQVAQAPQQTPSMPGDPRMPSPMGGGRAQTYDPEAGRRNQPWYTVGPGEVSGGGGTDMAQGGQGDDMLQGGPRMPQRGGDALLSFPQRGGGLDPLFEVIRGAEAPGGYDTPTSFAVIPPPIPLSQMTVAQVRQWQDQNRAAGAKSTAAGQFQVMGYTLDDLIKQGVVSPEDRFDANAQNRIAEALAERRGLSAWRAGQMSDEQFMQNLSMEWAGLPSASGASYYAGDGLNKATTGRDSVRAALDAMRGGVNPTISTKGGDTSLAGGGGNDMLAPRSGPGRMPVGPAPSLGFAPQPQQASQQQPVNPPMTTQGQPAASGGPFGNVTLEQLMGVMSSPEYQYAPPAERQLIETLYQQKLQGLTPQQPKWEFVDLNGDGVQEMVDMNNPTGGARPIPGVGPGAPKDQPAAVREFEYARQNGYQGSFEDWRASGRASTNVTVNTGQGEQDRYLYGTDAGLPAGWRLDRQTGEASEIPGGPADQEAARIAAGGENKDRQSALKLGTTLESLNLNIAEIENGGLPVTGAFGDFRRTGIGRALTGNSAVDFGNRTDQVSTSAALSEVQNMRDNSPTGGAVGQLTDSEREAIGNSITALNNSTSAGEYLRAARAYRDLSLNLAYGEGNWQIGPDGSVVPAGQASPAQQQTANPFVGMTPEQFSQIDINSLSAEELDLLFEARQQ